ncbi:MAG: phosphate/phosphite/phosphonate ABC transporter substrate-binding protein [Cytophagales bacterium]|nr:phosphate/phosphite/phosphonate ABC transporter substrate-binding protein [Cytophagales bacterium]
MSPSLKYFLHSLAALALAALASTSFAQTSCAHQGDLDSLYCDANKDLVADVPTDKSKWKNPSTLIFTYTPVEDPAKYENVFKPFTDYLSTCTGKTVKFYQVQSNAAEVEAMRSGRLHVAGFSTGPTVFAVNKAGAIPFAVKGDAKGFQGYTLITIVKASSPYKTVADLKGKKVAHTSPSSNSGNLAPIALLPAQGLTPSKDYDIKFSGKHDQSVLGVATGDYDAAHVASDVFERMAERGQIKEADFRVIYRSQRFPTSSFAYAHDLDPALASKMLKCFADYRFPAAMQKDFDGADRFVTINYAKDWEVVRVVDKAAEKAAAEAGAKK